MFEPRVACDNKGRYQRRLLTLIVFRRNVSREPSTVIEVYTILDEETQQWRDVTGEGDSRDTGGIFGAL